MLKVYYQILKVSRQRYVREICSWCKVGIVTWVPHVFLTHLFSLSLFIFMHRNYTSNLNSNVNTQHTSYTQTSILCNDYFLYAMYPFLLHFGCFILYDLQPFNAVHYTLLRCSRNHRSSSRNSSKLWTDACSCWSRQRRTFNTAGNTSDISWNFTLYSWNAAWIFRLVLSTSKVYFIAVYSSFYYYYYY